MFLYDRYHSRFGAEYVRFVFRHQAKNPKYVLSFALGVLSAFWILTFVAGEFLKNANANIALFLLFFFAGSVLILKSTGRILREANRQDNLFVLGLSEESRRSLYLYLNLYRLSLLLSICLLCYVLSIFLLKPPMAPIGYCCLLMLSGYFGQAFWLPFRSRKLAMEVIREESSPRTRASLRPSAARSIRFPLDNRALSLLSYQSLATFRRDPIPFYACFLAMPALLIFLRCAYPAQVDPALSVLLSALASVYAVIGMDRDVAQQDFWKTALPFSPKLFVAKNAILFSMIWSVMFISGLATFLLPGFKAVEYLVGSAYAYLAGTGLVWYVTKHHESPSHCFRVTTIAEVVLFYLYLFISREWLRI